MTAQQLKNSILQMAVQGKLVPQDPTDEPASVLLERIRAEKEKLIKEGKIKKEKNPSVIFRGSDNLPYEKVGKEVRCIADEIPFEIPDSWEWVRLGNICDIARGGSPRPIKDYITESADGVNWIKIGDSDKGGKYINSTREKIKPSGVSKSRMVYAGDFLLTNSMSFGRPYILNVDGCIHDGWLVLSGYQTAYDKDFLFLMLSSAFAYQQFCGVVSGAVVKNLNSDKVAEAFFPLPPLAEQKRIVAKIEELLPHIEEYDKAESKVSKLNAEFPEQLKKSILQWAIQGKLVPQNPEDEPASVLLERIRAEKAKLIKEGKIKKDKNESVIFRRDNSHYEKLNGIEHCIDDEIPFEIPASWQWVRLGNICIIARGGSPRPIKDFITESADGVNWIKIGDSDKGGKYINSTKEKIKPSGVSKSRMVYAGDFLLTNSMSFGRPYILNVDGCIHDGWLVLSGYQTAYDKDFLFLMLSSAFAYQQFCGVVSGAVVKNLNSDKVAEALFPLPPFAEQQRIVEAIESVFKKMTI